MTSTPPLSHPSVFRPETLAVFAHDKMGKRTIFGSERVLVGLNGFEPGQRHELHTHAGMDKVYYVLSGTGVFLLEGRSEPLRAGDMLIAPDGVPHGVHNTGDERLLLLAVLAPAP